MAEWKPDPKGVKATMKAWCNFGGTSDPDQICKHCIEADFVTMLWAYLVATKQIEKYD
jgi:hypothetical protein